MFNQRDEIVRFIANCRFMCRSSSETPFPMLINGPCTIDKYTLTISASQFMRWIWPNQRLKNTKLEQKINANEQIRNAWNCIQFSLHLCSSIIIVNRAHCTKEVERSRTSSQMSARTVSKRTGEFRGAGSIISQIYRSAENLQRRTGASIFSYWKQRIWNWHQNRSTE